MRAVSKWFKLVMISCACLWLWSSLGRVEPVVIERQMEDSVVDSVECPWPPASNVDYEQFSAQVPASSRRELRHKKSSELQSYSADQPFYVGNAFQFDVSGPHVSAQPMEQLKPGEFAAFADGILVRPPYSQQLWDAKVARRAQGPNVLIILLDSTSGPQFRREMPLTQRVLAEITEGRHYSFRRFHSFGGGSTHNKIPLHTGQKFDDFWADNDVAGLALSYQGWSFQRASRAGYVTSLINTFCPAVTDKHWKRSVYQNIELGYYFPGENVYDHEFPRVAICPQLQRKAKMRSCCNRVGTRCQPEENCIGDEWAGYVGLRWLADLKERYSRVPMFAHICFFETHGPWMQGEHAIDRSLSSWLREQNAKGMFSDTVVALTSDHGSTMKFLGTKQGNLETKTPTFELVVPRQFLDKVPGLGATLAHNSKILTTPADIYRTLMDFVEYPKRSDEFKGLGSSLFDPLPVSRSCQDAGIPMTACVCLNDSVVLQQFDSVDVNDPIVVSLVDALMKEINHRLKETQSGLASPPCRQLSLGRTLSAATRTLFGGWGELWEIHIAIETKRTEPMHLRAQITKYPDWKERDLVFTEIRQMSIFKEEIAHCWEKAATTKVSLHLCECA